MVDFKENAGAKKNDRDELAKNSLAKEQPKPSGKTHVAIGTQCQGGTQRQCNQATVMGRRHKPAQR